MPAKTKTPAQRGRQNRRKPQVWKLRLYVAGQTPKSIRAFANLKALCETGTVPLKTRMMYAMMRSMSFMLPKATLVANSQD